MDWPESFNKIIEWIEWVLSYRCEYNLMGKSVRTPCEETKDINEN